MKFAIVPLPEHAHCELIIRGSEKRPRVVIIGRGKQLVVLLMLLFCAAALFATKSGELQETEFAFPTPVTALIESSPRVPARVEHRTAARHFDGSRLLKAGDLVIMDGPTAPKVRQIAAAPNQTILLRRGNSLHALYLVGDSGYVVVSENESRLVHSTQIRASVEPQALVSSF